MVILLLAKLLVCNLCCKGWIQNLGQEGKEGSCPGCERAGGVHSILPGEPASSFWVMGRMQTNVGNTGQYLLCTNYQEEID